MADIANLPHVDPFLFVSEVTNCEDGECAEGHWNITGEEWFFKGHFPSNPVVPGVLIAESLAQISGMVIFSERDVDVDAVPMLANIGVKLLQPVRPPVQVRLESRLSRTMHNLHLFDVKATVGGIDVAAGTLVLSSGSGA